MKGHGYAKPTRGRMSPKLNRVVLSVRSRTGRSPCCSADRSDRDEMQTTKSAPTIVVAATTALTEAGGLDYHVVLTRIELR